MLPERLTDKLLRVAFTFLVAVWCVRTGVRWLEEMRFKLLAIIAIVAVILFIFRIIDKRRNSRM